MRQLIGKITFITIFVVLGAASVTVAALAMGAGQANPVRGRVVIEAGSEIPPVWAFLYDDGADAARDFAEFITDMSVFDPELPVLGEFVVEFTYNRKNYSSVLQIIDTVPPRGTFINRLSVTGDYIYPEMFVRDIFDATFVTVSYYRDVDFYRPGEQVVWVSLKDEGGNETMLVGFVYIMDGVRTKNVELGVRDVELRIEDFVFNERDRTGAFFITDIGEINSDVVGVFPVEMWVMGRGERFFVNVEDTVPPRADAVDVVSYVGIKRDASDFVVNIVDFSEVEVYFADEPDWDVLGEFVVGIVLEDAAGNIGMVESRLNIVEDTDPPVFLGVNTIYVALGERVMFRQQGITAWDARDGEVEFTVDASGVDTGVIGRHYAYFEAVDSSGNAARTAVPVVVSSIDPDVVFTMAQDVLDTIIREGMTDYQKANAIYIWTKDNINYQGQSTRDDKIIGAFEGFTRRSGDCYTYYAVSSLMLDMVGIPNITLERVGGRTRHWWSIIDVGLGWHHFDTTRHQDRNSGFHLTAARALQLTDTRSGGAYYTFDSEVLPEGVIIQ